MFIKNYWRRKMTNYQSLSPNIGVINVNESVKFYTETLGFQLAMSVPEEGNFVWAMVNSGSVNIMFQENSSLVEEYPQLANRDTNGCISFYIKVKGMKELYEKLQGTGYIAKEMHKTFYGSDEFAIKDINGHILTISEDAQ
jgi:uncharacterized glyoxalase superfamily protein PhnB